MWHVTSERGKNITTKNKKTAFENAKANRRSNNVSSKGKRKKLYHIKLSMEPEEDVKGHFLRDKTQIKGKNRELKCRVVRNWKVSLEDTVKAVQETALRGRCTNPANPLQLPSILMEAVCTYSLKRTHPTVSDFLLTHCLERDKLSKNHKEPI